MSHSMLPPVTKSVHVPCTPGQAFHLFTAEIHRWWPLDSHSVHRANAAFCGFEPIVGGRIYERSASGEECVWGKVEIWEPPKRLVFSWHPGREEATAQTVDVRFAPEGEGTRVSLVHGGWERLADRGSKVRDQYDSGWELVFVECYANHVQSQQVLRISL